MAIILDVKDYCQNCPYFEADVEKPETYWFENVPFIVGDTVIRCQYRKNCEYSVGQMKKGENHDQA